MTDQTIDKNNRWVVLLGFTCAAIVAHGVFLSKNDVKDMAYLFGQNLVFGSFIWVIFHAFVGGKNAKANALLSFILILSSLMLGDYIGYVNQKSQANIAFTEIQKTFSDVNKSKNDSQGFPQRMDNIDTTPTSNGKYGEMESFMKSIINQFVSLRNDYLLELGAVGWNTILDPNRIKNDPSLSESKVIINNAKNIVLKYESKTNDLLHKTRNDISTLKFSDSEKRTMQEGYDHGLSEGQNKIDTIWAYESATVNEVEKIINFLSARKGAWDVQNNQILFSNNDDLNYYNSCISNIQQIVAKEEALQNKNAQKVNAELNDLKK